MRCKVRQPRRTQRSTAPIVAALFLSACGSDTVTLAPEAIPPPGSAVASQSSSRRPLPPVPPDTAVAAGIADRGVPDPLERLGRSDSDGCVSAGMTQAELAGLIERQGVGADVAAQVAADMAGGRRDQAKSRLEELTLPVTAEQAIAAIEAIGVSAQKVCPVAAPNDEAMAEVGPLESGDRYGYFGPLFGRQPEAPASALNVLPETVSAEPSADGLVLRGIVRNSGALPVRNVVVRATVEGLDIEAPVPVSVMLSGEPAPFELVIAGAAELTVSDVELSADGQMVGNGWADSRKLDIDPGWALPAGERDPIESYVYSDRGDAPYPAVWFGSIRNDGRTATTNPVATVAWMSADGRLLEVETVQLSLGDEILEALHPGDSADYLIVVEAERARRLLDTELLIWGTES